MNKMKVEARPLEESPSAMAVLQGGSAIIKAENETQSLIAIQRPRDEEKALAGALKELKISPEYAKKAFYVIPFKRNDGESENIEGPSIKAALALLRRWGNCAAAARVVEEEDSHAIVEGRFLDHETNVAISRQLKVSRYYKSKKTQQMIKMDEGRFAMAINAAGSKVLRNSILGGLPAFYVDSYYEKAKELASNPGKGKKEERIGKMIDRFEALGIPLAILEGHLAHPIGSTSDEEISNLIGIYNALKDGQATPQEAFGMFGLKEVAEAEPKPESNVNAGAPSVSQARQGKLVS